MDPGWPKTLPPTVLPDAFRARIMMKKPILFWAAIIFIPVTLAFFSGCYPVKLFTKGAPPGKATPTTADARGVSDQGTTGL